MECWSNGFKQYSTTPLLPMEALRGIKNKFNIELN